MNRNTRIVTLGLAVAWTSVGGKAIAGDLNPPAGPVGPTMKTLTEVEPRIAVSLATTPGNASAVFRITQPGSYYLTGNVTGQAGKHGIQIASHAVTLDLNGFTLIGGTGTLDGINMPNFDSLVKSQNRLEKRPWRYRQRG